MKLIRFVMEKIYSKIDPKILLHIVKRAEDIKEEREELSHVDDPLQGMVYNVPNRKTFQAHYHNPIERTTFTTHEAFIVIKGKLILTVLDTDNSEVCKRELNPGDCAIFKAGGHSFEAKDDTIFYELKPGPYLGREKDKTYID